MVSGWKAWWIEAALVLLTIAGLGEVCRTNFIFLDDDTYVYANPLVQRGLSLSNMRTALTDTHTGMWQPLTWLSLQIDATLFGPSDRDGKLNNWSRSAWGFHLTSLLLHAANVVLLFRLLKRETGAVGRSAMVAALFAIHPLRVESVAWASMRMDVLSGLFFMLTFHAYGRFVRARKGLNYLLVLLCFLAAMAAKPVVATLPGLLILWDFWPLGRFPWKLRMYKVTAPAKPVAPRVVWLEKGPLAMVAIIIAFETLRAHQRLGLLGPLGFAGRESLGFISFGWYLWKTIVPLDLAFINPVQNWNLPLSDLNVWLSLLAVVAVTAVTFWQRLVRPHLFVGWLWYLIALLPVCGFFQAGSTVLNDHQAYLAQIGLFLMLVWAAAEGLEHLKLDMRVQAGIGIAILAILLFFTQRQVGYWVNTPTLVNHSVEITDKNVVARQLLIRYYLDQGSKDDLNKAIELSKSSIADFNDPAWSYIFQSLAYTRRGDKGDTGLARQQLGELARDKDTRGVEYLFGTAYSELAFKQSDILLHKEAINRFQKSVALDEEIPYRASAFFEMGRSQEALGDVKGAVESWKNCLSVNPLREDARQQLEAAEKRR